MTSLVKTNRKTSKLSSSLTKNDATSVISAKTLSLLPENPYLPTTVEVVNNVLTQTEYANLLNVCEDDMQFIISQFQKYKFNSPANITYDSVSTIANKEFSDLNEKLKVFTSQMNKVKTPGLFNLIDDLSKEVHEADLTTIWNKAVNAKPSLWARFMNIFDRKSANASLNERYEQLYSLVAERSTGLESKISDIEKELLKQENEQRINIKTLETTYEQYYKTFLDVRQQMLFVVYLEEFYKQHLDDLVNTVNVSDVIIQNEVNNAQEVLNDIQDKRLVLHKTYLQMPITAQQNTNLIGVCKNLLKEIQTTRTSSFWSIRSNLVIIGTALRTEQGMLTTKSAKELEKNTSLMANQVSSDMAIKGATLSSEARLQEANTIRNMAESLEALTTKLVEAKQKNQENIDEATQALIETTNLVKELTQAVVRNNN